MGSSYQDLLLFFLSRLVIETTGLDNLVIDIKLVTSSLKHGLFHTLLRYKSQDKNRFSLTNTMCSILSLQIRVRIPITVKSIFR